MPRRTSVALLALFVLGAVPGAAISQQAVEVSRLPGWTSAPNADLRVLAPGVPLAWDLTPRGPAKPGSKPSGLTAAGAQIPVRKDAGLEIKVTATRGVPVILVADGPLHPLDKNALFSSVEAEPVPGNPVAFAVGAGGRAALSIVPPNDGVWQVWVWVLRGNLAPPPAEETDPETLKFYESSGFTARQIALMSVEPDYLRAWNAAESDVVVGRADEPSAWSISRVELSVAEGPKNAPRPRNLLRQRQAELFPQSEAFARKNIERWQNAVDELAAVRGEAIAAVRNRAKTRSVMTDPALQDIAARLGMIGRHPLILSLLVRRSVERQRWSPEALAASRLLEVSKGADAELAVLPARASRTLGRLLAAAGAVDAAVVDAAGEVLAAASPGIPATLSSQPGWEALEKASGREALVTPPLEDRGVGVSLRIAAVPVRDPADGRLIGWILGKVYSGPLAR